MIKKSLLLLLLLTAVLAGAQIKFEPGYYLDNAGVRHDVQIRNADWNDNPRKFAYRESPDGEVFEKTIDEVTEFAIPGQQKFVRADVDMDRSESSAGKRLSGDKNPIYKNERLFLRTVVDGPYKLYVYEESGLQRFFYRTPDKPVAQLVYKKYHPTIGQTSNTRVNADHTDFSAIYENNQFRNQLWNDTRCPDAKLPDVERLKYTKQSLTEYFAKVNKCHGIGESQEITVAPVKKGKLRFGPVIGVQSMKFKSEQEPSYFSLTKNETGISFGLEVEYTIPTNANKLAFFADPHYFKFKGGDFTYDKLGPGLGNGKMSLSNISLPLGARYYFYAGSESRFFVDGVFNVNLVDGEVIYDNEYANFYLEGNYINFGIGGGFNYKRYSIAGRIYTGGNLHPTIDSSLQRATLLLKYHIL